MSKHTWREFERADMYISAARAEEMEHRERLARAEHIVDGLGEVKGEIVRCRDCKHYENYTCNSWQWHNWDAPIEVEPDGFCAWGERRKDE